MHLVLSPECMVVIAHIVPVGLIVVYSVARGIHTSTPFNGFYCDCSCAMMHTHIIKVTILDDQHELSSLWNCSNYYTGTHSWHALPTN